MFIYVDQHVKVNGTIHWMQEKKIAYENINTHGALEKEIMRE